MSIDIIITSKFEGAVYRITSKYWTVIVFKFIVCCLEQLRHAILHAKLTFNQNFNLLLVFIVVTNFAKDWYTKKLCF
jgi:hypothetical protein